MTLSQQEAKRIKDNDPLQHPVLLQTRRKLWTSKQYAEKPEPYHLLRSSISISTSVSRLLLIISTPPDPSSTTALPLTGIRLCGVGLQSRQSVSHVTHHRTNHVPVLDSVEGLLVGDVIHEDEAHGAAVVGRGDGAVTLLPRRVLHAKTNTSFKPLKRRGW